MALKNELQSLWSWPLERWCYFLDDDHSKRGSLLVMQGMLGSTWAAQSIGQGERLRWKWWWVLCRKVIKASQTLSWERKLRPGDQDAPEETMKTNQISTATYNIEEWMWGLGEDACTVEVRNNKVSNHRTEQKNAHSQHLGRSRRWHKRQGGPWLLRDTSGGSPSSGGGSSDWGSKQSSHQLTMMRGSRESNQAGRTGRGLRVKVNLPIFKDEKTKDAVTYHSW